LVNCRIFFSFSSSESSSFFAFPPGLMIDCKRGQFSYQSINRLFKPVLQIPQALTRIQKNPVHSLSERN
jgi:hypothetical protein